MCSITRSNNATYLNPSVYRVIKEFLVLKLKAQIELGLLEEREERRLNEDWLYCFGGRGRLGGRAYLLFSLAIARMSFIGFLNTYISACMPRHGKSFTPTPSVRFHPPPPSLSLPLSLSPSLSFSLSPSLVYTHNQVRTVIDKPVYIHTQKHRAKCAECAQVLAGASPLWGKKPYHSDCNLTH